MKKNLVNYVAVMLLILGSSCSSSAQFVIKVRPAAPVMRVRPAIPSSRHIWVTGDYVWRGGQYIYTDGYWAVPPPDIRVGLREGGDIGEEVGFGFPVIGDSLTEVHSTFGEPATFLMVAGFIFEDIPVA